MKSSSLNFGSARILLYGAMFLFFLEVGAQTVPQIDQAEAQKHQLKHDAPIYPPIAKAIQQQGDVLLKLEIDKDGNVSSLKPISGPPMLIQAAIDAAKQWKYAPFIRDGSAASVTINVTVPFSLGPVDPNEDKVAKAYFPLFMKCNQLMAQSVDIGEAVSVCGKAAEQADRFPSSTRFIERRSAYVYYANALIRNKQPKEAVSAGEKAIAVVLLGHDDGSGSSAAYGVTGQAKAFSGDLEGADKDLEVAEKYERAALDTPTGHDHVLGYSRALKGMLTFHSQVLTALGKQKEASAKVEEANKLSNL